MSDINRIKDYLGEKPRSSAATEWEWPDVRHADQSGEAWVTLSILEGAERCERKVRGVIRQVSSPAGPSQDSAEHLRHNVRIASLEMDVAELRARLTKLEGGLTRPDTDCDPKLLDVVATTEEMFSHSPTVEVLADPEDPENRFVVITVESSGEPRELVQKRLEWHDRISKLSPGNSGAIRLSIVPR